MTTPKSDRPIFVILNPVSGFNREAKDALIGALASHHVSYILHETEKAGDAERFTERAIAENAPLVIAYGGDGTVAAVADILREHGSKIPMAIVPGGTANVMSVEMGIPQTIPDAIALAVGEHDVHAVDMGTIDGRQFLLRAGIGYEAEMSAGTTREDKTRLGRLAYFRTALRLLRTQRPVRYVITIDGVTHSAMGVTCMVCNSANIGIPGAKITLETNVSDGKLDAILVRGFGLSNIVPILLSTLRSVVPALKDRPVQIDHWQGEEITVETRQRQAIAIDGEPFKRARRSTAKILKNAVILVVPKAQPAKPA